MSGRILTASICVVGALISVAAFAQTTPAGPDCAAQATEKKLHGAALKSFMRKCDRDAAASACDVERPLIGIESEGRFVPLSHQQGQSDE
jgi:hypothetical protein